MAITFNMYGVQQDGGWIGFDFGQRQLNWREPHLVCLAEANRLSKKYGGEIRKFHTYQDSEVIMGSKTDNA